MKPQETEFNGELDSALMHLENGNIVALQASTGHKKPLLKLGTVQIQLSNSFLIY